MKLIKNILLLSFILCGCNPTSNQESSSSINSSLEQSSISVESSSSSTIIDPNKEQYDGYYKPKEQTLSFKEMRSSYIHHSDLPNTGNSKILVVPVKFKDSNYALNYGGYSKVREDIETLFFGDSYETGWESVTSFYKKSSYGHLNISGKVTDWFELDKTFFEVNSLSMHDYLDPSIYVLREISKWYKENYHDVTDYDTDKDGYIDAVWMVYDYFASHEYNIDWAYAYWDFANYSEQPSVENPIPYTYAWAGISFMYSGGYKDVNDRSLVDAHTFIHETGHLLGIQDYYDSNYTHSYSGGLDMMDCNIGDHTGLTKYMLNWTKPYVVEDECEITIRPFEESGDLILYKKDWNGSAMDEYLLIDFYTPTGLNKQDSDNHYMNILLNQNYPRLYQNSGVRIYHVDARLGYFENNSYKGYIDRIISSENDYSQSTKFAHSNTSTKSVNPQFAYYQLIENGGTSQLSKGSTYAKDEYLFQEGDYFDPELYTRTFVNDYKFNDGESLDYIIEIKEINENGATIKFIEI